MDATAKVWLSWLGLGLVLELLAVTDEVPWNTLSEFLWGVEESNPLWRRVFLLGLTLLTVHIVSHVPRARH